MILQEFSAWFVWILPLIASLFVPVIGRYTEKGRNYFVVAIAIVSTALAISLIPDVWGKHEAAIYTIPWLSGFGGEGLSAGVFIDPLSVLFTVLISFFSLIIAIYSIGYMKGESGLTRYYYLILLFIGSMIGLVLADNMLQMFIFWEMVGLCSYALISFWYKKPESIRAGVKVFIMTRIGDIALLAAIGLLFLMFGTLSFRGIINGIIAGGFNETYMIAVAFLVLGGAIAKSAQLPLFTWLYSAMEAPTSVSALLHAATMVKAGIYLLSRVILIFSVAPALISVLNEALWFPTIIWVGTLTALVGASLALHTTDIKGVLAYSTISQIGFMMAGLGAAAMQGWFGSLYHMISHAFFEGLGFLIAGGLIHAVGTRDMRLMGGLRNAMPLSFILMGVMVITTSGLPPFASFFSKGLIITSVTEAGGVFPSIILIATTGITFAYCFRMFSLVFMGEESGYLKLQRVHESPTIMLIPAAILAGFCIYWGVGEPAVASFLGVTIFGGDALGIIYEAFFNIETPIFLTLLLPIGIIAYYSYFKRYNGIRNIAAGKNPLSTMLKHAFFFDYTYDKFAKGITGFSTALTRVENALFARLPDEGAAKISRAAQPGHAITLKKGFSGSYRNYIAAAVLGFILIVVLIILTFGIGLGGA